MPYAVTHILIALIVADVIRDYVVKNKKKFTLHYVLIAGIAGLLPDADTIIYLVLNMLYGGSCCDRFKSGQCGEGIRYPRVVYTGEVKPCLHWGSGIINNDSSDLEIGDILEKAKQFIRGLSTKPYTLDSIKECYKIKLC